jgi:hypothetical protein|uniref:Uncharacterized protein n=1 Tax=virus sp. ctmTa7 TaxID=2828255 RepID=A0A8S5RBY7_9VIRU|nr:MAG TPA: hypothetical protein [virus sp. ctmTa7]
MTYEEIYSQFYSKQTDPTFFKKYSKEEAYDLMKNWLHSLVGTPYIRKCFSSITLDDNILELTFKLNLSIDDESDNYFVKDVFAQGMVICWEQQKIDKITNMAAVLGGKEEKSLLNNYKNNMTRVKTLEVNLRKFIRDYGYVYNEYIGEQ